MKNMVILFDESGTPSIKDDKRTNWFVGVAVVYEQPDEEAILSTCKADFGLARPRPLKNYRISHPRALRIAEILTQLPVTIYVSAVETADPTFRAVAANYEPISNEVRGEFRGIRPRPIAQFIHSHVIDHCFFNAITDCFESGKGDAAFLGFIDNWAIPREDMDIYLKVRCISLREKISWLSKKYYGGQVVSIAPLELLIRDDSRKRFVDVVASVFSRAYLKTENSSYSRDAADILHDCGRAHCSDVTECLIDIMQHMLASTNGMEPSTRLGEI